MDTLAQLRAGHLAGSRRLDLNCGLSEFPREIFELADTLEVLNLTGNALSSLPEDLGRLRQLRVLFCSDNRFEELPASIGQCRQLDILGFKANRIRQVPAAALPPSLRWLILTDNQIEALPETLGNCRNLQKLMLAGNRLQALPASLAQCERLELLRISANRLTALPNGLLSLPRLAWLAFADNPLGERPAGASEALPEVPWADLCPQDVLGEGASGVIQRALWRDGESSPRPVAIKLFKGQMTSDGSPQAEMAACLAAGSHPRLIGALGRIGDHPEGRAGLLMPLIDPLFQPLAGPPSLESCTRDCYAESLVLPAAVAVRLALGVARAAAHLHGRGLLHGDLYAHNILWDGQGDSLLGDFGAASFYPAATDGAMLERLEVRAFGILLGELLARCVLDADLSPQFDAWRVLQAACCQADAGARPVFAHCIEVLEVLGGALP
ncbi:MAG: leucine-rich repeat-containing protein kinase family protein [Pseudomonas sp.]|uniref:leucine-rich repeat-containing protein kinase family protein n=1 Tax=Pseudomonas sp. TaxID=306 RepID=UPI003397D843